MKNLTPQQKNTLNKLNNMTELPQLPNASEWIKTFYTIDTICEQLGVTKIEVPKEEEPEEGKDILEGMGI